MDVDDYIDYLDFDMVRSPIEQDTSRNFES